jgi:hypothetical protein
MSKAAEDRAGAGAAIADHPGLCGRESNQFVADELGVSQGTVSKWRSRAPSALVLRAGAQVGLAHAASMLALGAVGRPLRRARLADGLVAIFAALGAAGAAARRRGAVCVALPGAA